MTLDSVAAVQARIAQIEQLVSSKVGRAATTAALGGTSGGAPAASSSAASTLGQSPQFASMLADAMASGAAADPLSDAAATGSSDGLGGSSFLSQLSQLSQLAPGSTLGGNTAGTGSVPGLVSALASATGTRNALGAGNGIAQQFLANALAEQGKPYVYGATASVDDPNPRAFDCSELTKWAAARAGVTIPDGATAQYLYVRDHGTTMTVQQALHTPGALLFHFGHEPLDLGDIPADGHVAISLGDGVHTIEARGHAYGTNVFDNAAGRSFNFAGMIPAMA